MRLAISLMAYVAVCYAASAKDLPFEAPPEIAASVKSNFSGCKGSLVVGNGFANRQDINEDGKQDWIIDYSKLTCDSIKLFCGPTGCLTTVFATMPNGRHVKVLDENVQGISFKKSAQGSTMILELQGSACGKSDSDVCEVVLTWNGSKFAH